MKLIVLQLKKDCLTYADKHFIEKKWSSSESNQESTGLVFRPGNTQGYKMLAVSRTMAKSWGSQERIPLPPKLNRRATIAAWS